MNKIRLVKGNLYELRLSKTDQAQATAKAQVLFDQGMTAENAGHYDVALKCYRKSIAADPKASGSWVNMGSIEFNRGNLQKAEKCYRAALRIDPNHTMAHYNLATCLAQKFPPNRREALSHYRKALDLQPGFADAHFNLAVELGFDPALSHEAIRHWQLYLQNCGANPGIWKNIAQRELANLRHSSLQTTTLRNTSKKPAHPPQGRHK